MYWSKISCFVKELVYSVIFAGILIWCFFGMGYITIVWNGMTIMLAIFIALYCLFDMFPFITFSVLAITDVIRRDYVRINANVFAEVPYKSSSLLDKKEKNANKQWITVQKYYYLISVAEGKKEYVLKSQDFLTLDDNTVYTFTVGKRSKVILDFKPLYYN